MMFVDAERALHLLKLYKERLSNPQQQQLRQSVDKVIGIFNSELFKSLIGEFTFISSLSFVS